MTTFLVRINPVPSGNKIRPWLFSEDLAKAKCAFIQRDEAHMARNGRVSLHENMQMPGPSGSFSVGLKKSIFRRNIK